MSNDIKVVAPMNMGKGLKWDEPTDTYYVAIDDKTFEIDELGRLRLRISALEDNMLKIREDGIYQGNTARPDLANLYVSNLGDDNNAGTREQPLRTIQKAVEKLENIPAFYTIHLHEGHEFEWVDWNVRFAKLIFKVYGSQVDELFPDAVPSNAYYRGYTAKDYPRPTINVRVNKRWGMMKRNHLSAQEITMRGIRVNVYGQYAGGDDDGSLSGHYTGFLDTDSIATFHGCILNEVTRNTASGYRNDVMFRCGRLLWVDSLCENIPLYMVSSSYTSQVTLISWNNDKLVGNGEKPDHEALTKGATVFKEMAKGFTLSTITGIQYDRTTKSLFGMTVNWDIFKETE